MIIVMLVKQMTILMVIIIVTIITTITIPMILTPLIIIAQRGQTTAAPQHPKTAVSRSRYL